MAPVAGCGSRGKTPIRWSGIFPVPPFAGQVLKVAKGLGFGLAQILAKGFVLDQHNARPEQVNQAVCAGDPFDRHLKAGDGPAGDAKDLKELVPERPLFRALAFGTRPVPRKPDRVVADFIPRNRHDRERTNEPGSRPALINHHQARGVCQCHFSTFSSFSSPFPHSGLRLLQSFGI